MAENELITEALERNNIEVAQIGHLLAYIVIVIGTVWYFITELAYDKYSPIHSLGNKVIIIGVASFFGVLFINVIIENEFKLFAKRNVEISGCKKWIFYASELVLASIPFLIIWLRRKL